MRNLLFALSSLLLYSCLEKNEPPAFAQANAWLARGEQGRALREYQRLLRSEIRRSELYCNLGNALLRDGQTGRAVVCYEKGLLLAPADSQIQQNESVALRGAAAGTLAFRPAGADYRNRLASVGDMVAGGGMVMLLVSCVLLCLAAISPRPAAKSRLVAWASSLAWFFGPLFLLASGLLLSRFDSGRAIVLRDVSGRSGPSASAAKAAPLYVGEQVEIKNRFQGWVKVQKANGQESWLAGAGVAQVSE